MPEGTLEIVAQLTQLGIAALSLYLYFKERDAHKETRDTLIKELKELHALRILDYQLWLDIVSGMIASKVSKPLYQPPDQPISVNAPKDKNP